MTTSTEARVSKATIYIDGNPYKIASGPTLIRTLRTLPVPPVTEEKHLWLDIEDEQDQQLDPAGMLNIVDGMRFFTEVQAITIRIDRVEYERYERKLSGAQLRTVPSPDVAPDRDLWLDVPDKRDVKVQDEDVVHLKSGMRFFTAPGRINPGQDQ